MKYLGLVIVSWLLVITSASFADVRAALDNGIGGRGAAMGFSQTASPQGVEGIYWNPASLSGIRAVEVATYASEIYGTNYKTLGVVFPAWGGKWGLLALSADQGNIPQTSLDINGRPAVSGSPFGYNASVLYLSYGRDFGKLSLGTNLKYLAESLSNNGSSGFALDLGLITRPAAFLSVGAKIENLLATPMKWNTAAGTEDKVGPLVRIGVSVIPIVDKLTLNGDLSVRENSGAEILTGIEYDLFDNLALRGGVFSGRPTFGLGLNYNDLVIDYSYVKGTEILEDSQRVSLSFTFGPPSTRLSQQVRP